MSVLNDKLYDLPLYNLNASVYITICFLEYHFQMYTYLNSNFSIHQEFYG